MVVQKVLKLILKWHAFDVSELRIIIIYSSGQSIPTIFFFSSLVSMTSNIENEKYFI